MNLLALHRRLSPLLRPLSLPYSLLMKIRRDYYGMDLLPRFAPGCPCVSVGNIAWGGTGKTPLTAWLLDWADKNEVRAVVLSRGYGATPGNEPLQVMENTPAALAGDEPLMLAQAHPKAAVVVFPKRAEAAYYAEYHCAPDLFILDDGMQHLAMMRHADIVLLRPEDLRQEWNHVIPSGSWREGKDALKAASAFVIKSTPEAFTRLKVVAEERLSEFKTPFFSFTMQPSGLHSLLDSASKIESSLYKNTPFLLISGIGNPDLFSKDAAAYIGRPAEHHMIYPDHHKYTEQDIRAALRQAAHHHLPIICTAKDAVKLFPLQHIFGDHPVWILKGHVAFGPALFTTQNFPDWWEAWWLAQKTS